MPDLTDLPTLISKRDHLGVLRHIRSHKIRDPDLVIKHGKALLGNNLESKSTFPVSFFSNIDESERLAALEQICISALDIHDQKLADKCYTQIRASKSVDPDSARVRRLLAMCLESEGELSSAAKMYDDLLEENSANLFALKRKYCIMRMQVGNEVEAREALNKYISANQGDAAGWKEMSKLCMEVGDYKGAAFCLEEVILANPFDSGLHCHLAELYVTIGGLSNLKLARKHMAQSIELCTSDRVNLRALYGLVSAAGSFLSESSSGGRRKEADEEEVDVAKELLKFGTEKIIGLYKGSPLSGVVSQVMETQTAVL